MIREKMRLIPMTYDKVFKSVLTSIEARDYLSEIISDITRLPKEKIKKDMVFKNSELMVKSINEKRKISDLVVEVKDCVINLEMNKDYYDGLVDRNHEYITKIRESMIGEGKEYKDLKKVIQINFDNYNIYKPDDRVVIKFEMLDEKGNLKEGVGLESYHVILPNVKKKYYNEGSKDKLVKRLVIMLVENSEELEKIIKECQDLRPIGEKVAEISQDKDSLLLYDEEEHKRKINNTLIRMGIEKGWSEARKEGRAKGIEEGLKEGIKKGIKEGIKTGVEKGTEQSLVSTTINLLKEGISPEVIVRVTGFSKEKILTIKKTEIDNEK